MVLRSRWSIEVAAGAACALCCRRPCRTRLVLYTSYITHVRTSQKHVYDEGDKARGRDMALYVGVRGGGGGGGMMTVNPQYWSKQKPDTQKQYLNKTFRNPQIL